MNKNLFISVKICLSYLLFVSLETNAQLVQFPVAPLALDNYWVYEEYDDIFFGQLQATHLIKVNNIVEIDSIKYFEIKVQSIPGILSKWFFRLREDGLYAERRDSTYPYFEEMYYKQNAMIGDNWQIPRPNDTIYYSIIDTLTGFVFGNNIIVKILHIRNREDIGTIDKEQIWCEEFGLLADDRGEGFTYILKGCIIDGIIYGDTTVTSIEFNKNINLHYNLFQNYPNPFNTSTIIEYEVRSYSFVNLSVYNSLGQIITTLVKELKSAGKYQIKFDAGNLSTGIYFYRLSDGTNSIIKKMVLTK